MHFAFYKGKTQKGSYFPAFGSHIASLTSVKKKLRR